MTAPPIGGPLPDAEARARAATLFDRNLVVAAGAGTGKTALLVERALNLVAGRGLPVERIAAITFTEKAAAELRQRLATGLSELGDLAARDAAPGAPDLGTEARRSWRWLRETAGIDADHVRSRARGALAGLDAAAVTTIHAFCADLLRGRPREAGVDPAFAVDEGPGFDRLFDDAWETFLLDELGPARRRDAVWRRALLLPGALDAVRDLGLTLAGFAIPGAALRGEPAYRPADPRGPLGAGVTAARDGALDVLVRATGLNPNMRDFLTSAAQFLADFLDGGPAGMAAASTPIPLDTFVGKGVPAPGKALQGAAAEEVAAAAKRAQSIVKRLAKVDEETIGALVEAAAPLALRAREAMLAEGLVSFDALLRLARDLLAASPPLRRALGRRLEAILVDEFQDTDPLQYEILFFLAEAEGPAAADAWEARLEAGRLFIVGDAKQSIYRFRGADMEAYRRAVDRVIECGGERIVLTASFRSPDEIVGPVNAVFDGWIGPRSDADRAYEPPYEPITSARGPLGAAPRVEIWSIPATGGAAARRRAEADAIAAWIAGALGRDEAAGRPLAFRDVAILYRSLTNVGIYAQALRRAGIPHVVEGGRGFYERPEVGDLIAFLRAAVNPNDGASVLAVMRSVLGGVPDAELAAFAAAGGRLDRPDGGAAARPAAGAPADRAGAGHALLDAHPNVARTLDLLRRFRAATAGRAADEVVRAAIEETPLALLHAAAWEGPQRLANLRKITARAEESGRRGSSLEETLELIERDLRNERAEGESPLADETVDAVRILTVHKAKGLEYPVVIVPDLGRAAHHPEAPATEAAWIARADGEGRLAVRLERGPTNLAWAWKAESDRAHESAEEKRVLYVACTRAGERLILVNSSDRRSAPWRDALAALGYDIAEGFPPDGPLDGGRVVHRRVPAAPAPAVAAEATLDPAWAEAARRFEDVVAAATAAARPPLRWPSGARDAAIAGASDDPGGAPEEGRDGAARPRRRAAARAGGDGGGEGAPVGAGGIDVPRLAGTAVHAALERWDHGDPAGLRAALPGAARRAVDDHLERTGRRTGGPDERDRRRERLVVDVEREARSIVEAFLASPLPRRIPGAAVVAKEMPVILRDERDDAWLGACDLVYREPDGVYVVADWKTDRDEGDAPLVARYRGQLAIYAEAVRRAVPGARVRAELVLVRAGRTVPIPGI